MQIHKLFLPGVTQVWPAATTAEVSGLTRPPYARRLASRISPVQAVAAILSYSRGGGVRLNKEHKAFLFSV
jgi:hypothetical protein